MIRAKELAGATILSAEEKRWDVRFNVRLADGRELTVIASADSFFTEYSGIWFGTLEEHEEALA